MKNSNLYKDKNVYIEKSKIHGFGVFANKNFKKGDRIYIIKGKIKKFSVNNKKSANYHPNWIGIAKNRWIDPIGPGAYQNHSSNPNCGIKGRVTVCALKNIKKGEEITIDYSITEEQPLWFLRDNTNGEKLVRSIQFMPQKKFKKYLPYIPSYFQSVYKRYHGLK